MVCPPLGLLDFSSQLFGSAMTQLYHQLLAEDEKPKASKSLRWLFIGIAIGLLPAFISLFLWARTPAPSTELRYLYVSFHGDGSGTTPLPKYGVNQILSRPNRSKCHEIDWNRCRLSHVFAPFVSRRFRHVESSLSRQSGAGCQRLSDTSAHAAGYGDPKGWDALRGPRRLRSVEDLSRASIGPFLTSFPILLTRFHGCHGVSRSFSCFSPRLSSVFMNWRPEVRLRDPAV